MRPACSASHEKHRFNKAVTFAAVRIEGLVGTCVELRNCTGSAELRHVKPLQICFEDPLETSRKGCNFGQHLSLQHA